MITPETTIKELLEHPIGHDVISKILMQMGVSNKWIDNPVVGKLKLKQLEKMLVKKVGPDFFETLYTLFNQESDRAVKGTEIKKIWWKEAIFYQIYPRSFKDSNGDGIGDLRGILSKLDYLQELGITGVWLSPIYDSPLDDNGYDISNYHEILSDFGTMSDFEDLVEGLKQRDMKLIMDLVVNHTSDEHPWFQEALKDVNSPYHDYYIFNDKANNWKSFFSGSAWRYFEENDEYALRLFSNKQMDLNCDNENVRHEVIDIIKYWKDKGVDGFRLDVINYIAKNSLEDGNEFIGDLMEFTGIEHYYYGEKLHKYLNEIKVKGFEDAFSVGETPGIGFEMARLLTHEDRNEMDTVFIFDHLETPGHVRFDDYQYDLRFLGSYYKKMFHHYSNSEWPSLFVENHDNPRMISKVSTDLDDRKKIGKLIAVLLLTLRGTPFIYQGQELGLVNHEFETIDDFRDVESLNKYQELLEEGKSTEEALNTLLAGSRDHARVGMPWHEGFSEGKGWIDSFLPLEISDHSEINDEDSIYHTYKELIKLRKENDVLVYGETEFVYPKQKNYLGYYRKDLTKQFFIEINLVKDKTKRYHDTSNYKLIYSNMKYHLNELSGYEVNVYLI
ncbi:MAG: alpha-glucosidase [Erysipelothrix sp.]|nr:alpha-glucosidase [Erysipelothrix sp.]